MALTSTTLSAAITATDVQIRVTSATGFAVGNLCRVDDEFMAVVAVTGTVIDVRRGLLGSAQVAHTILASCDTGLPGDFPAPGVGKTVQISPDDVATQTLGASATITVPKKDTQFFLASGTTDTYTLPDPTVAQDGLHLTFMANSATAYVVTNTTGFNGGGTGADVATFGGAIGDNFEVLARNGTWAVLSAKNVTLG